MNVTAADMNRLQAQLVKAISDLEQIKKADAELKESICGYYSLIIRWIEQALVNQDPVQMTLTLTNIKESLQGTINEWKSNEPKRI